MIDADVPLSITHQCALLALSCASYYRSRAPRQDDSDAALNQALTLIYERHPDDGSRRMQLALRELGLAPLHPQPRSSVPNKTHATYSYLLRESTIEATNEVWAADISYISMGRGHVYVVAIMDWYSRRVLAWRLSNTLDASFCVDAFHEALSRFGTPTIFNTDQGSQFMNTTCLQELRGRDIQISIHNQGCWRDNVWASNYT